MESCVKNCGSLVHDEVATKGFMEEMRDLIKHSKQDNIKNKLLEMLQTWGMNFRSSQKYRIVTVKKHPSLVYVNRETLQASFAGHAGPDESGGLAVSPGERGRGHVRGRQRARMGRRRSLSPLPNAIWHGDAPAPLPGLRTSLLRKVFFEELPFAEIWHRKRSKINIFISNRF